MTVIPEGSLKRRRLNNQKSAEIPGRHRMWRAEPHAELGGCPGCTAERGRTVADESGGEVNSRICEAIGI